MTPDPPARVVQLCGPSAGGIRSHVATLAADLRAAGVVVVCAAPAGVFEPGESIEVPVPDRLSPFGLAAPPDRCGESSHPAIWCMPTG